MEEITVLEASDETAESEDSLRSTALRYKSKFPWADPESIESVAAGFIRAARLSFMKAISRVVFMSFHPAA